jgi:hypothetical protein
MRLKINNGFVRILCTAAIVVVIMMLITCDDTSKNDNSKQQQTLLLLSGGTPKCVKDYGGYCGQDNKVCSDDHVMWTPLGCPNVGAHEGRCCLPTTSCSALGGVCRNWQDSCPSGWSGTGPMDCPNGDLDQCCIPAL